MGLTAAVELSSKGYNVKQVTAKELFDLPSWHAAGYFDYPCFGISAEKQQEIEKLGLETFQVCQEIKEGKHAYLDPSCVRYLPVYSPASLNTMEKILAEKNLTSREPVTIDFDTGVRYEDWMKSYNYLLNTGLIMKKLHELLEQKDIPVIQKEIKNFNEISAPVIINCTGLGAQALVPDSDFKPTRGHLLVLNQEAGTAHMNYMIFNKMKQERKEEFQYMFPVIWRQQGVHYKKGYKSFGVLGGTFKLVDPTLSVQEQEELDKKEFKKILQRHQQFFYGRYEYIKS